MAQFIRSCRLFQFHASLFFLCVLGMFSLASPFSMYFSGVFLLCLSLLSPSSTYVMADTFLASCIAISAKKLLLLASTDWTWGYSLPPIYEEQFFFLTAVLASPLQFKATILLTKNILRYNSFWFHHFSLYLFYSM